MSVQVIANPASTALMNQAVPRRGFENFNIEELIVPRLRLLQSLSKSVTDGNGKTGEFQDSLSNEILGDRIEVIPLSIKNGAVLFEIGEGLRCRSSDGVTSVNGDTCERCPFGEYHKRFHDDGTPPKCSSTKEFLAITKKTVDGVEKRPIVISFMKTSYKEGRKLESMAFLTGKDLFARSYVLKSFKDKNDKGVFAVMEVSPGEFLKEPQYKEAENWYNLLTSSSVVIAGSETESDAPINAEIIHDEV